VIWFDGVPYPLEEIMDRTQLEHEVDANYDAFLHHLPEFMRKHANQTALMRQGSVVAFYPTLSDALVAGRKQFEDGIYSVQEVTDRPIDLGFSSHAVYPRIA
jgi:hypothetical protein